MARALTLLAMLLPAAGPPGVVAIRLDPPALRIDGPDRRAQLLVTGTSGQGTAIDLTHEPGLSWSSDAPGVARVEPGGEVVPVAEGRAEVVAAIDGREARAVVVVSGVATPRPVDFEADVLPILTRLGCNAGACHGKSGGRNGFRLSLLGGEPALDHESLAREGRGRRLFPARPGLSLLLLKPTAQLPHGGGLRLPPDSPECRTLARWIAEGAPGPGPVPAPPPRLAVEPEAGTIAPGATGQLRVVLRATDGDESDVTRLARFESVLPDRATVDERGRFRAAEGSGEAVLAAHYRGAVAVARFAVREPGAATPRLPEPRNVVDRWVFARLAALGIEPAGDCTDAEFARRSALDLTGTLPDPDEIRALETDADPGRRDAWVDRLLRRPEYADRMAMTWSALLRNRRTLGGPSKPGTFAFHDWIRRAFASDRPFDAFVADLLTARGDPASNPAVVWYRSYPTAEELADDVAPLFLGLRIQCARCHRHPSDRWGPDDYRGFAAFFERLGRKPSADPATPALFLAAGPSAPPRWPGGPPLDALDFGDDPRRRLADWLRRPDNPALARAVVNRTWKQLLGRGLVEPEDDLRPGNPPSHPELLDALARDLIAGGYDLKALYRTILSSRTYQRSSLAPAGPTPDPAAFARFAPRRLPAEVLLDAIDRLTGVPTEFEGLPRTTRTVQLPDEGFDTPDGFLAAFGRPERATACDCERSAEPNLSQSLRLLNGSEIERKVSHPDGRAARLARAGGPDREHVRTLYRVALCREPTPEELDDCLAHLARRRAEGRPRAGFEDLIWAILNLKEFQFIL